MKITNEQAMLDYGEEFAKSITFPAAIEVIGDVGAGKTTFVRGLAKGLGVKEAVTSPSFTISKQYAFFDKNQKPRELIHYDFYRLENPGLMQDDLRESIEDPDSITIVEWSDSVKNILPENRTIINIKYLPDGTRELSL